jgi:hypothetical protein
VLSGVIRKSLNGSEVLVNHGGLHRLRRIVAKSGKEGKKFRAFSKTELDAGFKTPGCAFPSNDGH